MPRQSFFDSAFSVFDSLTIVTLYEDREAKHHSDLGDQLHQVQRFASVGRGSSGAGRGPTNFLLVGAVSMPSKPGKFKT